MSRGKLEQANQPKRKYQSKRRTEQARETRQRILAAAFKLFSAYGYLGATIEAIAEEAGVVPLTVYASFSNKHSLLASLVDESVGGDDRPIPLLVRPGPRSVLQEQDPERQIHRFAGDISGILKRVAPLFEIMRMAAKTEPEIATLLKSRLNARLHNLGIFVQHVSSNTPLRGDLDDEQATEIVWALTSPELFQLLTRDRSWSVERYSQWLGDTLVRLLLP